MFSFSCDNGSTLKIRNKKNIYISLDTINTQSLHYFENISTY